MDARNRAERDNPPQSSGSGNAGVVLLEDGDFRFRFQVRRDFNGDDRVNIADPVGILFALFRTSEEPPSDQVPCF